MLCIDNVVEGVAGQAGRFGRQHLPDGITDQWVIWLDTPRMVVNDGDPTLRSQIALIVAPTATMDRLFHLPTSAVRLAADRRPAPTHGVVLAIPVPGYEFQVEHLDRDVDMPLLPHPVGYFEGHLPDPGGGRLIGHALARGIAHGDLPVGTRNTMSSFAAAACTAFVCADMVSVIRVGHPPSGGDSGDGPDD